jgi:hypothetical protein
VSDSDSTESIQDFNARHVFAIFPEGGIALELASGTYSSLNASAAAVCRFIVESRSWEEAFWAVKRHWSLSNQEARKALSDVRDSLARSRRAPLLTEDLPYRALADGYALFSRGRPLVGVSGDGDHVRLLAPPSSIPFGVEHCLRLVSPKVLAARGCLVLHASTCLRGRNLTAFCGLSGAGKSTVSRLLGSRGWRKLADELLVVSAAGASAWGHPEAEEHIYRWCAEGARTLQERPDLPLSAAGLMAAIDRPATPLTSLTFLDARMRGSDSFETDLLTPIEALKDILLAMFLGRKEPAEIRSFFSRCRDFAAAVRCERARTPTGLEALEEALAAYSTKTAS